MVAAFFLRLAAAVVGIYWLIGRDIDRAGKHKDPEDATSGVPSVSAAPPIPSPVALGATLEVTSQDGKKAAYTVSNLLPAAASQFTQVKGTLYSIADAPMLGQWFRDRILGRRDRFRGQCSV